jgi:hypothetical protein
VTSQVLALEQKAENVSVNKKPVYPSFADARGTFLAKSDKFICSSCGEEVKNVSTN